MTFLTKSSSGDGATLVENDQLARTTLPSDSNEVESQSSTIILIRRKHRKVSTGGLAIIFFLCIGLVAAHILLKQQHHKQRVAKIKENALHMKDLEKQMIPQDDFDKVFSDADNINALQEQAEDIDNQFHPPDMSHFNFMLPDTHIDEVTPNFKSEDLNRMTNQGSSEDTHEEIRLPDFHDKHQVRFLHDLSKNVTGIVDLSGKQCFIIKPLTTEDTDLSEMHAVAASTDDLNSIGTYITKKCKAYPIYRLQDH